MPKRGLSDFSQIQVRGPAKQHLFDLADQTGQSRTKITEALILEATRETALRAVARLLLAESGEPQATA